MIWVVTSAVLFEIMKDAGFGMEIIMCLSLILFSIVGFAWVNDTDLVHSAKNSITPAEDILEEAQDMLSMWEGVLLATRAALVPKKSFWYMIDFKFKDGKWKYRSKRVMPGLLQV